MIGGKAVAYREDAGDTGRGARTHTTQIKVVRVDRKAVPVKRKLDLIDRISWHAPKSCPEQNITLEEPSPVVL